MVGVAYRDVRRRRRSTVRGDHRPAPGLSMDGRAFLTVARDNLSGNSEAHWRSAAGRAYYALMLEVRDSLVAWGLSPSTRGGVHQYIRLRVFTSTDADMKRIGQALD